LRRHAKRHETWTKAQGSRTAISSWRARHYDEPALAALIIQIGLINVWNRLNATVRQVAGEWTP
jgi:alkylhydroperoxidase family enzyme